MLDVFFSGFSLRYVCDGKQSRSAGALTEQKLSPLMIPQYRNLFFFLIRKKNSPRFITGVQAKGFFMQSNLPPMVLAQIW
jgi:hypothetical protein